MQGVHGFRELNPPQRLLLGAGPSNAEPRVLRAMATALIGQFDPAFTALMDEVMQLCRLVFQTRNRRSFPVSGTSRAGLEERLRSLLGQPVAESLGLRVRSGPLHEPADA